MVSFTGMSSLRTSVAVHSVRVNHQLELDSGFLQGIHKQKSILEVNIVVASSMGDFQRVRLIVSRYSVRDI